MAGEPVGGLLNPNLTVHLSPELEAQVNRVQGTLQDYVVPAEQMAAAFVSIAQSIALVVGLFTNKEGKNAT